MISAFLIAAYNAIRDDIRVKLSMARRGTRRAREVTMRVGLERFSRAAFTRLAAAGNSVQRVKAVAMAAAQLRL